MKVAIQGVAGSFHDQAAQDYFRTDSYQLVGCSTFEDVFKQVHEGYVDFGIVAIENSLYGSIHETYDMLTRTHSYIVGEIQLTIHQQLLAREGTKLSDITEIVSHPAALDQCRQYIHENFPNVLVVEHEDTAGAAAMIAKNQHKGQAAIASTAAAEIYKLNVLEQSIEDEPENITRFVVIAKNRIYNKTSDKVTLILTTDHTTGSLYMALKVFNDHSANLTKIESRHVRGKPYKYQFIIDVMCNNETLSLIATELEAQSCQTQILGHYHSNI